MPPTRTSFPRSKTALVVLDVINPLDFRGGRAFAPRAVRAARTIAALATRARRARVPVIFVNDNFGRWRSDIDALIRFVSKPALPGSAIARVLRPGEHDFVVLKSTLSGFHQTTLEAMLRQGGVETVVMTGLVTGNCVLFTAADAYMRDFKVVVARDGVADQSRAKHEDALDKMADVLKARIVPSARIRFRREARGRTRGRPLR